MLASASPAVSIILPTYNRANFLPQALASIKSQTFTDWELIVVDDGSTDNSREQVVELTRGWPQPIRYVYQENQGAYGARNTGLDLARGRYIAFFDSDDVWLPHHLQDCVAGLEVNPEVAWVYGACRLLDHPSGRVTSLSTFHATGKPRPHLLLKARQAGKLHIVEDPDLVRCALRHGLNCGLQNSVIRRAVFEGMRFRSAYRAETEDGMFLVRSLAAGHRIGYFDNVHVLYHVHGSNSSGVSGTSVRKHIRIQEAFVRGYEELARELPLSPRERRALNFNLGRVFFWNLGYSLYWRNGQRARALAMFRKGLEVWPWSLGCWKTYLLALFRTTCRPHSDRREALHPFGD
jgi:glycosyltransferase involved in cell wall biosynthesis